MGVFLNGFIADLNRVLNTITKAEVTSNEKLDWSEIQVRRCKILLSKILKSSRFFYSSGNR